MERIYPSRLIVTKPSRENELGRASMIAKNAMDKNMDRAKTTEMASKVTEMARAKDKEAEMAIEAKAMATTEVKLNKT